MTEEFQLERVQVKTYKKILMMKTKCMNENKANKLNERRVCD